MHFVVTANTSFNIVNYRSGLIKRLIDQGHDVTVVAPADTYTEEIHGLGCDFQPLNMSQKGENPIAESVVIFRCWRALKVLKPDAVISFTAKNNLYMGIAARLCGINSLPTITGLGLAFQGGKLRLALVKLLYRVALKRAVNVFFQNPSDKETFLSSKLASQNQSVIVSGSGVNPDQYAFTPLPAETQNITFLMVTRLLGQKGVKEYCEAATSIRKNHSGVDFLLAGPFDHDSHDSISEHQLERMLSNSPVQYLGYKTDIRSTIAQSHVMILPSYYNEGTPRVLLEAGAMGCPLITTDWPGCRDTVSQNKSGLLIPPRCAKSLSLAMEKFLNMPPRELQQWGNESHALITSKFTEAQVVEAYIQALTEPSDV